MTFRSRTFFRLSVASAVLFALSARWGNADETPEPEWPPHGLFVMNADGTGLKPLVPLPDYFGQGSPEFSSDGTQIAFDAWRPDQGENYAQAHVFIAQSDGRQPMDLGPGAMPSWSPRARRICFSQYSPNRGVWVMNADGTDRQLLDGEGWSAVWSPDGTKIAYTANRGGANILLYDIIEGDRRYLFNENGVNTRYRQIYWNLSWSPDSQWIAFKGQTADGETHIALVSAKGAGHGLTVRVREPKASLSEGIAWHPDGKKFTFAMRVPQAKTQQLYVVEVESDEPPTLVPGQPADRNNTSPAWSPDGKRLVFTSQKRN